MLEYDMHDLGRKRGALVAFALSSDVIRRQTFRAVSMSMILLLSQVRTLVFDLMSEQSNSTTHGGGISATSIAHSDIYQKLAVAYRDQLCDVIL